VETIRLGADQAELKFEPVDSRIIVNAIPLVYWELEEGDFASRVGDRGIAEQILRRLERLPARKSASQPVLTLSLDELIVINNVLNEICHGIEVLQFNHRIGAGPVKAQELLNAISHTINKVSGKTGAGVR
jgi:hypothetical protein